MTSPPTSLLKTGEVVRFKITPPSEGLSHIAQQILRIQETEISSILIPTKLGLLIIKRFPKDFMFQLTKEEYEFLRFQIGSLKRGAHSK